MIDALVLAGSPNSGPLRECSPARYEALIPIGSRTMVEYVVDALLSSCRVARIAVVGPQDELKNLFADRRRVTVVNAGAGMVENVERGLAHLPGARRVLLATCDIPLITTQAIEDFLDLCRDQEADLYYPIIPQEVVEGRFSQVTRTYVTLKDGRYTGGNLFLINPEAIQRCISTGQQIVQARKSPLRLSRIIGFTFLLKFLLRRVTLEEAQEKVSRLLGVRGVVVVSGYPEVGVDVDKPSDLSLVEETLDLA